MNPKEKANLIFNKMYENQVTTVLGGNNTQYGNAIRCGIFLVDEILESDLRLSPYNTKDPYEYWNEVKKELESMK
jgi:hypothetical protein